MCRSEHDWLKVGARRYHENRTRGQGVDSCAASPKLEASYFFLLSLFVCPCALSDQFSFLPVFSFSSYRAMSHGPLACVRIPTLL